MRRCAITAVFICLNAIASQASSQGGSGWYRHAETIVADDTIGFVYGENISLRLRFWASPDRLFTRLPSNGGKTSDLYQFTSEPYFAATPDTSNWREFKSTSLGISFRHPSSFSIVDTISPSSGEPVIYLNCNRPYYRITRAHGDFTHEANNHGWSISDSTHGFLIQGNDAGESAYLEGENWQAISAVCSNQIYGENNQLIMGDSLSFFAYLHHRSSSPLVVDKLFQPEVSDTDCDFLSEEIFVFLATIKFQ